MGYTKLTGLGDGVAMESKREGGVRDDSVLWLVTLHGELWVHNS